MTMDKPIATAVDPSIGIAARVFHKISALWDFLLESYIKKAQNNKELQIWPERLSDAKNQKGYDRMPGHSLALFARV